MKRARFVLDLYVVTLKIGITGSMHYGRNSYDFHEGTMMFMAPGQVLAFEEPIIAHEGWGLFFHPDLIRTSDLGRKIDKYHFFSYDVHEALHVSDDEKKIGGR